MTAKAGRGKNTLCQITNGDFFQNFDRSWATLCQVLHRQWLDLFTVISLQGSLPSVCTMMSLRLLSYRSCLASSSPSVIYSIYSQTNYIHTFIHPYINTFIYSYIHTFMRTHHIHKINSYMVASVAQSIVWSYPFSSVLNCFKWLVLNNGQLEFTFRLCFKWLVLNNGQHEFTFCLCFKWLVLNNGQLEFTFHLCFKWLVTNNRQREFTFCLCFKWSVLNNGQLEFTFCQVVSPKQWAAWVYLLSCFKWLVLNNVQLEFIFFPVSSG